MLKIRVICAVSVLITTTYIIDAANGSLSDDIPANKVLYIMAHNAHSSSALGWRYYQQQLDYEGQWNAGARGGKVILQWRLSEPKLVPNKVVQVARKTNLFGEAPVPFIALCHEPDGANNCALTVTAQLGVSKFDVDPAANYFAAMALLLRKNPKDTVVIILESYLTKTSQKNGTQGYSIDDISKKLNETLKVTGLGKYAWKLTPDYYGENGRKAKDWPTLGEMRKADKRALIFINSRELSEKSPYLNNEGGMFKRSEYAFDWVAENNKKDPINQRATAQEIDQMCDLLDTNPDAVALRVDIGPESSISDRTVLGGLAYVGTKISFINKKMKEGHAEVTNYDEVNSKQAIEKRLNQCQVKADGTWPTVMMTDFVGIGDLKSIVENINKERERQLLFGKVKRPVRIASDKK